MTGNTGLDTFAEAAIPADEERRITLCETLDRVLNKGVVVGGEIVISVADIDLIYLNLQVLLASIDTAVRYHDEPRRHSLGATA